MTRLLTATAAAALLVACGSQPGVAQTPSAVPGAPAQTGAPVQTAGPQGKDQKPAFAGQTRAPEVRSNVALAVTPHVTGLAKPWGLAFLPDGALVISEKGGRLRVFESGKLSEALAGLPAIDVRGQGGLLGLAVDPAFARNGRIYMSYSEGGADGMTNTAVARARLTGPAGQRRLSEVSTIWRQGPQVKSVQHYGGRLVFDRQGMLFVVTGDRSVPDGRKLAQNLDGAVGKVVRITTDGKPAPGGPYAGQAGTPPGLWSIGHRNIQSAALHPRTGDLWEVEHGTRGGDELNIVKPGKDYGWPTIAYGIEYQGGPINGGITQKTGMEQPAYYWDPVIAPSGMAFYNANLFPAWKGSLLVGGLADKRLTRLVLNGDKVVGEERLLADLGERIRDVIVGPDGALYLATDNDNGRVLRVAPK